MGAVIPIALGVGTAALGAMQASRQRAQQNSIMQQNAMQQQQAMMQAAMQQQMANQQYQQQKMLDQQRMQAEADAQKATIPVGDGSLKGLNTVATSPLGDPTTPNMGRQKLLGG